MNLPILCALFSLASTGTLPESTLTERGGPTTLSRTFELPPLVSQASTGDVASPKGLSSLFLATDGDTVGGGGLFFPMDAEPIDGADDDDDLDAKVRDLVRREIQAGQLLYDPAELAELTARGALLIEWLDQGQAPAPDQVDQLERRVNQLEERVTDYLARDYRILVYNTYRTDREEFNHRRARWKLIDERWRKFEHTPERRAHLNQWLAEAIEVSRPGSTTPLPPAPAWYYEPVEMLAQQADPHDVLASASDQDDPFDVSSPDDLVDSTMLDDPSGVSVPERRPDDTIAEPENTDPFRSDDVTAEDEGLDPEPYDYQSEIDPTVEAVPDDFDSASSSSLPEDLIKRDRDEPLSLEIDLSELVEMEPAEDQREPADEPRETAVVNVDLLRVRVAGHNLAVLRLADELGGRDRWTAATLAPHVDRLIDLHERRKDLVLFVELTEPQRRRAFEPIETTRQSVTLLAEKFVGARLWAMGGEFQGNSQQRQAELAALADFSRRLAQIAFDSPRSSDVEIC